MCSVWWKRRPRSAATLCTRRSCAGPGADTNLHTILRAAGKDCVEGADIAKVDANWQPVPGTERRIDCDVICLAVGLTPLVDVLWQAGCEMVYVPALGGHVPLKTTR